MHAQSCLVTLNPLAWLCISQSQSGNTSNTAHVNGDDWLTQCKAAESIWWFEHYSKNRCKKHTSSMCLVVHCWTRSWTMQTSQKQIAPQAANNFERWIVSTGLGTSLMQSILRQMSKPALSDLGIPLLWSQTDSKHSSRCKFCSRILLRLTAICVNLPSTSKASPRRRPMPDTIAMLGKQKKTSQSKSPLFAFRTLQRHWLLSLVLVHPTSQRWRALLWSLLWSCARPPCDHAIRYGLFPCK